MSQKRIGLLIDSLIGGGAERVVLNFAEKFSALGHDVHVIIVKNEVEHVVTGAAYQVHALSEDGTLARGRWLNKRRLAARLKALVAGLEADGKRFDFFTSNAEDMDRLSLMAGLPNVFIRYRNSMKVYLEHKIAHRSAWKRAVRRLRWTGKFRRIYRGRHIVTVSEALQREIVEQVGIKPRSITTIYNPFDFDRLRERAEEPADLPAEPYILYAAKFENRKRQDVLLRAYASLDVPYKLVLLGGVYTESDHRWLADMEALIDQLGIRDKVIIPGFRKNPYPWMKHARLFAMSSDSEGLPTVLIESLILGTPVVSTDCPTGPSEILTGDFARFLSPVGDADTLARNIAAALERYPTIDEPLLERFRADYSIGRYLEHCAKWAK